MLRNKTGYLVTTRLINFNQVVRKIWGKEFNRSDVVYEFSNGRKFESSDRGTSGVYRR